MATTTASMVASIGQAGSRDSSSRAVVTAVGMPGQCMCAQSACIGGSGAGDNRQAEAITELKHTPSHKLQHQVWQAPAAGGRRWQETHRIHGQQRGAREEEVVHGAQLAVEPHVQVDDGHAHQLLHA